MRGPYKRPDLARRRALKPLGDTPLQAVPDSAVLPKNLLARTLREGRIEGGPVLGCGGQLGAEVERPVMGFWAQRYDEVEGTILIAFVERFEALGPEAGDVGAHFIHHERGHRRDLLARANADAVDPDQRAEMEAHERRRHRRSDGIV